MSRVGIKPVELANGVTAKVEGKKVSIKGAKSELSVVVSSLVNVKVEGKEIIVEPTSKSQEAKANWGLFRNLIKNMVIGVSEGYKKDLELEGVGFRAQAQGKTLKLNLGFSHDVIYNIPAGIEIKTPKPTEIQISGADKQRVGQVAAEIRGFKEPEPYKGKGIHYVGEYIRRKEGKKK